MKDRPLCPQLVDHWGGALRRSAQGSVVPESTGGLGVWEQRHRPLPRPRLCPLDMSIYDPVPPRPKPSTVTYGTWLRDREPTGCAPLSSARPLTPTISPLQHTDSEQILSFGVEGTHKASGMPLGLWTGALVQCRVLIPCPEATCCVRPATGAVWSGLRDHEGQGWPIVCTDYVWRATAGHPRKHPFHLLPPPPGSSPPSPPPGLSLISSDFCFVFTAPRQCHPSPPSIGNETIDPPIGNEEPLPPPPPPPQRPTLW